MSCIQIIFGLVSSNDNPSPSDSLHEHVTNIRKRKRQQASESEDSEWEHLYQCNWLMSMSEKLSFPKELESMQTDRNTTFTSSYKNGQRKSRKEEQIEIYKL